MSRRTGTAARVESQTPDAPILGGGAAPDQALRLQAVNQAGDRDRSDPGNDGELVLGHAWLALQPRQDDALGPRRPVFRAFRSVTMRI